MADPRFFHNHGPFTLGDTAAKLGIALPAGADAGAVIADLASLDGAGPGHIAFFSGVRDQKEAFGASRAGFCLVPAGNATPAPDGMVSLEVKSVPHAWAMIAAAFYPEFGQALWPRQAIAASAVIDPGARLAPGVVVGEGAQIGAGSRIGPGTAIGPGVTIGRDCDIGAHVTITHAYVGDGVTILPGAQIGQPGFGFASSAGGHAKTPQLGRVIVQDRVEIGANTTIDRGALGDTVIGEGTKIDNLVQIGHNCRIGRNCLLAGMAGLAGSTVLEDSVMIGAAAITTGHLTIGAASIVLARAVVTKDVKRGGRVGGYPAQDVHAWRRETAALRRMSKGNSSGRKD